MNRDESAVIDALRLQCPDTRTRVTDRLVGAHDASHYQLTPRVVVAPSDAEALARVLGIARANRWPVAFRSGGTSLSGQAGTDSILIDTRRNFRRIQVLEGGDRVRAQPGATVRAVNARLARHGRKLGPDPASEIACTIGGVVANNSSGMSCGTHANAYCTLESAVLVLPSGTVLDTGAADAAASLKRLEPEIAAGLVRLRDYLRSNTTMVSTVRRLHAMKNTMGYGLNAFLDFDDPVRILEHLVVGSEGTLAFVADVTFRTLPVLTQVATSLLVFTDIKDATKALPTLVAAGFATIELMDSESLRVARRDPSAPQIMNELQIVNHAALLVEFREADAAALGTRLTHFNQVIESLPLASRTEMSTDPKYQAQLWHIRKGLFTAVAGARPAGTTALLEDIAVPVERLEDTCAQLIRLFDRYGYEGSVIFGHAKDGNIHFLMNERFDDPERLARYEAFTESLVDLVLSQGGTLKAEHGTGRMMAPFVERQYGTELYDMMWEVKRLIDPGMLLNPGVVLSDDPRAHTKHLKIAPSVEREVDRCVECGYCEPACPSRDLTLTPRGRIVMRRELQIARDNDEHALAETIEREYEYDGVQTCAVDGMCQMACPVLIDTGDLTRRLRAERQSSLAMRASKTAAAEWATVSQLAGRALTAASFVPPSVPHALTSFARGIIGAEVIPQYTADLPAGGARRVRFSHPDPVAVFFPSCTKTIFRPVGNDGVSESLIRLCERVGIHLRTPHDLPALCCGTPWKSKGLTAGYDVMRERVTASLLLASEGGRLPVVCDASSCTEGLQLLLDAAGQSGVRVLDSIAFVDEYVLPFLGATERVSSITLHPTCSSRRLGLDDGLSRIARFVAESVSVPDDWGCCAFAGDRGMLHPELTATAVAQEVESVLAAPTDYYASSNRTCEIGMTRATGHQYQHILQILDQVTAQSS